MNLARIFALIDKRTEELKAELRAEAEREPGASVDSPWCTVTEYASFAGVHAETVRRWIVEDGMPATDLKKEDGKITGTKRTTRIHRDEADAWRKTR